MSSTKTPEIVASEEPKQPVGAILDKDAIRQVVQVHIEEVRNCYNQGLARDPTLKGRVEIRFTIGPEGAVQVSAVSGDNLPDESVGACLAGIVREWTFPAPLGGHAIVTYPFLLMPSDEEEGQGEGPAPDPTDPVPG